jgi:D-aminopeptidase
LEVSGRPLPEVELFAGALAPYGVKPLFFSGDPLACRQAVGAMPALSTYTLEKSSHRHQFDPEKWRIGLARAAVAALAAPTAAPYRPAGPIDAQVEIRGGAPAAAKLARRWQLTRRGACIRIKAPDLTGLYLQLVRLCYLTPTVEKLLPLPLRLFNLRGRLGLAWVRWRLRAEESLRT